MADNQTTMPTLSHQGLAALIWLRDTQHHIARILVNGREPTTEPCGEWTHIELIGHNRRRRRISLEVWREIAPFTTINSDTHRMYAPTMEAIEIIKEWG